MMGGAGAAYDDGMLGVIEDPLGGALALFLVGFFFARTFRRLRIMTVVDFMHQRYGKFPAAAITAASLFSNITWVGAVLVAFGLIFESLTNIPLEIGIISGAIVIFIYTAVGGMWAVGGAISPHLPDHTFRLIPHDNTVEQWLNYLRAWTIIGVVDISAQTLIQRVGAAKSERVAQNSFYLGGLGYLLFGMLPVLLGIVASVSMPELQSSEAVIPTLAIEHLHPVAVALFVGAILAAIMSSADSALLASASIIAKNVLPFVKPNPSPRLSLNVARIAIPACGLISIAIAMKIQVVFDLMVDANILGLAAIIVPFIMGVWWKKANGAGAIAAIIAGLSAWLFTLFTAPNLPADFIGLAASIVTMLIVTPLTQKIDPPRDLRDSDGHPMEMKNRLGTLPLLQRVGSEPY
jgi:Na+/proline symporter